MILQSAALDFPTSSEPSMTSWPRDIANASSLIERTLVRGVRDLELSGRKDPFFVCDVGNFQRQYRQWSALIPRCMPHYAVKCNPDPRMIRELASYGSGFDCASQSEMQIVLSEGVDADRIIFANPCKQLSCLRFAQAHGIKQMTFDNEDELRKLHYEYPEASLLMRIMADDPGAKCRLSEKFGVPKDDQLYLLSLAKTLGLDIVGVSFHVGSGATSPTAYELAIRDARAVFDHATRLGHHMKVLDIGGGFSQKSFPDFAPAINRSLSRYFSDQSVKIISEPGRYFAEGAYVLACSVSARRVIRASDAASQSKKAMLYLNDGVYGSFSNCVYENLKPRPSNILNVSNGFSLQSPTPTGDWQYSIWGPTCDSADCINRDIQGLPELRIGDWLFFDNMGAYSMAVTTRFNGFDERRRVMYVNSEQEEHSEIPALDVLGLNMPWQRPMLMQAAL